MLGRAYQLFRGSYDKNNSIFDVQTILWLNSSGQVGFSHVERNWAAADGALVGATRNVQKKFANQHFVEFVGF